MTRLLSLLTGLILLAGCATQSIEDEPKVPLGDFSLGHNVVVASKMAKGPVSREATAEEWIASLRKGIDTRFGRYEGEDLYHLGISIEGYMLAPGGIPVLYSPKSALIILVTVWDDEFGKKLNDEPHQLTIFESTDAGSVVVGSGHSRTKAEQMDLLSYNAAKAIETWLSDMHEEHGWFTDNPTFNPPKPEPLTGQQ